MQTATATTNQSEFRYRARPHQLRILNSRKKFVMLGAGVGSGKTDVGTMWTVNKAKCTPEGVIGLIAANTYTQLIDSTCRNVYKNLKRMGIPVLPDEVPNISRPFNIRMWNGRHWVEILCRSLEKFELLSGIEFGWWWVDEAWQTTKSAIDLLQARLRDTRMPTPLQGLITTTLDDPDSWMYDFAVENLVERTTDVVYASTYDNRRNLPPDYIEDLMDMYSPSLFDRMVRSKWVSLISSRIYAGFDREVHVTKESEYDPALPILWAWDFNVGINKPMSSVLAQMKKRPDASGRMRNELHAFDEIVIHSADTRDAIDEFNGRGWRSHGQRVIIYGDASGKSKDSRSRTTDYSIIALAGYREQLVPLSNPPVRDRHNSVNALIRNAAGDVRLRVHPRCKNLIKGLETGKMKKGSGYVEEETTYLHVVTALGYLVAYEFPVIKLKSSGDKYWMGQRRQ